MPIGKITIQRFLGIRKKRTVKNKISKKEKEERAKRFNISIATYYNWEKTKPELIKLINLGLEKEKDFNIQNEIMDIKKRIDKLEKGA